VRPDAEPSHRAIRSARRGVGAYASLIALAALGSCTRFASSPSATEGVDAGELDASRDGGSGAEPPSIVQSKAMKGDGGLIRMNLDRPVGAHRTLIVAIGNDNGPVVVTVDDSLGNNYERVLGPIMSGDVQANIYVASDTKPGDDSLTLSVPSGPTFFEAFVHEYSGLATRDVFREGAGADGTAGDAATTPMQSPPVASAAGDLLFGFGFAYFGGIVNFGQGFTSRLGNFDGLTEDQTVETPGPHTATATMVNGTRWLMLVGAFRQQ
jgi:hypothetical protein